MIHNNRFEVFGSLTKTETVFTIDDKMLPQTLVFEALHPFPGYYADSPSGVRPIYLYLALEEQYTLEDILRASQKIQCEFELPFEAGKGFIEVHGLKYNVLRIRHLENYNLLEKLQQMFVDNGIRFLHKTRKYKDELVKIRIIKFFALEEVSEKIYLDSNEKFHAYIEIPKHLSWEDFEAITKRVKYNWIESKFDAAMAAFYHHGELHEVVRIYSDQMNLEYLQELRKLYLDKMK
jgi:hypothetical protein